MKTKLLIYIAILSAFAFNSYAQNALIKKGDKQYDKYAYIDATKTYERVAAKGYKSADLFQKLGNAYYFNSNLEKAAQWYGELFAIGSRDNTQAFFVDAPYAATGEHAGLLRA